MTNGGIPERKNKKVKKKRNKRKTGNQMRKTVPSLSKQQASGNWVNFLKANGLDKKLKKFYERPQQKQESKPISAGVTKVLSLDCEMVASVENEEMLARVSVVNYNLQCVYDKYVKPTAEVGDYRTRFSGIRAENLREAADYDEVREEVLNMIKDKILVGHALFNDFRVLNMKHPNIFIRDTSTFPPFKKISDAKSPSLKKLAKHFLNENIQEGEHCSVQDAKTAMMLYKKFNHEWELFIKGHKEVQILE